MVTKTKNRYATGLRPPNSASDYCRTPREAGENLGGVLACVYPDGRAGKVRAAQGGQKRADEFGVWSSRATNSPNSGRVSIRGRAQGGADVVREIRMAAIVPATSRGPRKALWARRPGYRGHGRHSGVRRPRTAHTRPTNNTGTTRQTHATIQPARRQREQLQCQRYSTAAQPNPPQHITATQHKHYTTPHGRPL